MKKQTKTNFPQQEEKRKFNSSKDCKEYVSRYLKGEEGTTEVKSVDFAKLPKSFLS